MNNYTPLQSKIISIKQQTADTKSFRIKMTNFNFTPGQFVMAGLLGHGEAPFSISSSPNNNNYIELTIKNVGKLTNQLHQLSIDDSITIRGPFGNGFPIHKFKHKNVIIISGGCGLAPMKSVIDYALNHKSYFDNLQIFYGASTPDDLLFKSEFNKWKKTSELILTVDHANKSWSGNTGFITSLISDKTVDIINSITIMCGPPIMYQSISEKLIKLGLSGDNIYLSLERNMQCGVGLCQHCTCGEKYVCTDGPIFTYNQVRYQSYKKD